MMDADVKAKWVAALRSGKYKQSKGTLGTESGCNCCLGVLARIQGVPFDFEALDEDEDRVATFDFGNNRRLIGFPPEGFGGLDWKVQTDLANMNDGGRTFAEIADHIEKEL